MLRTLALALLILAAPSLASAADRWVLMPVYATNPPPQDPTLLRLSQAVGAAIAEHNAADVRLVSRAVREEHCQDQGHRCPDAIARILEVDRVIAVELTDDYDALVATVFDPPTRSREVRVTCTWRGGPDCDLDALGEATAEKTKSTWDPEKLGAAFEALRPRIEACLAKTPRTKTEPRVTFRVREDGRPIEVRIQPKALQRKKPYRCAARVVESLRVVPFTAERMPFVNKPLASP